MQGLVFLQEGSVGCSGSGAGRRVSCPSPAQPDGTVTITAKFLLKELNKGPLAAPDIAKALGEPVFKVRGSLRELKEADLILEKDDLFHITDQGREKI